MNKSRLVIIGIGGLGSQLLPTLLQWLNFEKEQIFESVWLVDGDKYEESNLNRQVFDAFDNKAESSYDKYRKMFPNVGIQFVDKYLDESNIHAIINEDSVVISGVDNHATRMLIENHMEELDNCTVINSGNEYIDGNIFIMQRKNEKWNTPKLSEKHPEVAAATDKNPAELSCQELSELPSGNQLVLVNASCADRVRVTLYAMLDGGITFYETFLNVATGNIRNVEFKNEDEMSPKKLVL